MHAIEVSTTFSAAHGLRLPGGGVEPLHGHDFRVTVTLACAALDALETVLDFHEIEKHLETVVGGWRSRNLNEIEPFASRVNPSAERIAEQVGRELVRLVQQHHGADMAARGLRVVEVRLTEAPGCAAVWAHEKG